MHLIMRKASLTSNDLNQSEPKILGLPDELLARIFSYLIQYDVFSLLTVNKRFYYVALAKLYDTLYINSPDNTLAAPFNIPRYYSFSLIKYTKFLKLFKSGLPPIRRIHFHDDKISKTFLITLEKHLPNTQINFFNTCKNIKDVKLDTKTRITPDSKGVLFTSFIGSNSNQFVFMESSKFVHKIRSGTFSSLTKLAIINDDNEKLWNGISQLNLTHLSLYYFKKKWKFNIDVLKNFKSVQHLSLRGFLCYQDIIAAFPRDSLKSLSVQTEDGWSSGSIDNIISHHSNSIVSVIFRKYTYLYNIFRPDALPEGEVRPRVLDVVNELNKIPDKYPKLTFVSIDNSHFVIDRCFGEFIDAEQMGVEKKIIEQFTFNKTGAIYELKQRY